MNLCTSVCVHEFLHLFQEVNIWPRIEQYKQIFVEPRSKGVLNEVNTSNFIFFCFLFLAALQKHADNSMTKTAVPFLLTTKPNATNTVIVMSVLCT